MNENKYDDATFFEKYSHMLRSQKGLAGAGEWPTLQRLLPDMRGKRVLDLGCGYGWHCKYAIEHGANHVIGVDISTKMIDKAKSINNDPSIDYMVQSIETCSFEPHTFDLIISSLAFHYIEAIDPLIASIASWLDQDGQLIFTVEHPIYTSNDDQDWIYDDQGNILYFPVDHYFYEGIRHTHFLGEPVTKYHRTLTTYIETLLNHGLTIEHVVEPQPPESMMDIEGMKDEMRRPMMLIISARK